MSITFTTPAKDYPYSVGKVGMFKWGIWRGSDWYPMFTSYSKSLCKKVCVMLNDAYEDGENS